MLDQVSCAKEEVLSAVSSDPGNHPETNFFPSPKIDEEEVIPSSDSGVSLKERQWDISPRSSNSTFLFIEKNLSKKMVSLAD